jgi:hypothetical protein
MNFGSSEFTNLISYVSLIISGTLAIFYIKDRHHKKYAIESDYSNQLLTWHASVIDVLTELSWNAEQRNDDKKFSLLPRLSSLIEQGRFFFPNIDPHSYGTEKPPAYRGYRNLALDFLVATYNLHHKPSTANTDKQAIYLQRLFTSIVFEIVRPSDRLATIRKLTDRYFVKDLSVEDLQEQNQIDAVSHMWDSPR